MKAQGKVSGWRMDVSSHFECIGNGGREIGGFMRCKHVILGHDWKFLNVLKIF